MTRPRLAPMLVTAGRLARATSPFADLTRARGVTWLEPELLAAATYSEIMDGRLRDPVFRGLIGG